VFATSTVLLLLTLPFYVHVLVPWYLLENHVNIMVINQIYIQVPQYYYVFWTFIIIITRYMNMVVILDQNITT